MAPSDVFQGANARRGRKTLSLKTLGALEPLEAAGYFVVRRSEGLTESEQGVLEDWLAEDASRQRFLASVESAWQVVDEPGDSEILTAMRTHALASRPRTRVGARLAAVAPVALVAGLLLLGAVSIGRRRQ